MRALIHGFEKCHVFFGEFSVCEDNENPEVDDRGESGLQVKEEEDGDQIWANELQNFIILQEWENKYFNSLFFTALSKILL